MDHCTNKDALVAWRKKGRVSLSWLATNVKANMPIDLSDTKFKLSEYSTKDGSKHWCIEFKKKRVPEIHLYRTVTKEGTIEEGQDSKLS